MKGALTATLVFVIFGTIFITLEMVNTLLNVCNERMMHPVILSIVVYMLEELPLAGLRWNLKTSANHQDASGWGIIAGILSIIAPLIGAFFRFQSVCIECCPSCSDDETQSCCIKGCIKCCNICCCDDETKSCCIKGCIECCNECCSDEPKTCCDKLWSRKRVKYGCACYLTIIAIVVTTINALNWAGITPPGAELCVQN